MRMKFSGLVHPDDTQHHFLDKSNINAMLAASRMIPPYDYVEVSITHPIVKDISIPQYAPTQRNNYDSGDLYNPAHDCDGYFMSCKYQPDNNCYAYGCDIATNTFAQPGRKSGYLLTRGDFQQPLNALGDLVSRYACYDGLIKVGTTHDELASYRQESNCVGHFVALVISCGDHNWPGDYHWVRCDNSDGACDSWSQKDGGDQVTNFDFSGEKITDPSVANWTVNQGATGNDRSELIVEYKFYCYMFVPYGSVDII